MSVAKAFTAGDTLVLDLNGTAYRCYHVTAAGVATLLGSGTCTVTTGTLHGNFNTSPGTNTITNFDCWAKYGYSPLNAM